LVSSAVNDEGTELIAVVLGVENYDMVFEYSKMLLEYGFKNYSVQPVIAPNSYITSVPVLKAAGNHNLDILASPEGLKCLLPNNSTKNDYEIEQHILENIEAPVKKGDVLGYIEVKKDGVTIGKIDAVASRDVEKKTANDPILKKVTTGALIFLLMFLMLRFTLRRISRSLIKTKR